MKVRKVFPAQQNMESGGISSPTSEIGSDELFVTCLNFDTKNKIKLIKNQFKPNGKISFCKST